MVTIDKIKKWLFGFKKDRVDYIGRIHLTWWRHIKVRDFDPLKGDHIAVNFTFGSKSTVAPVCIPFFFRDDYLNKVKSDQYYYGILRQHINLIPYKTWGMYVPLKFNGEDRPTCNLDEINWKKRPFFNSKDSK